MAVRSRQVVHSRSRRLRSAAEALEARQLFAAPIFPVVLYTPGSYPNSIAVADFDGDGRADVAAAVSSSSGGVVVQRGMSDGSLAAAVAYPTGHYPSWITAGDLNGDGRPDLVTSYGGGLSVQLNNGAGGFGTAIDLLPSTATLGQAAIADFNGDGYADIAVAQGATLRTLLGNPAGTFADGPSLSLASSMSSPVQAADMDGDGHIDLIATVGGRPAVLYNNGDASFASPTYYWGFTFALSPRVADVNGDGRPDLAWPYSTGPGGGFGVAINHGGRAFGSAQQIGLLNSGGTPFNAGSPCELIPVDLDHDGRDELAITSSKGALDVYHANAAGSFPKTFTTVTNAPVGLGTTGAAADIDGDGKLDLILAGYSGSVTNIAVVRGAGDGRLQGSLVLPQASPTYTGFIAAGDINEDGLADFLAGSAQTSVNTVSLAFGQLSGGLNVAAPIPAGGLPNNVTVADFNHDGHLDVFTSALTLLLGHGDGTFAAPITTATALTGTGATAATPAVGDFDGDGKIDVAISHASDVAVLYGDGSGSFVTGPVLSGLSLAVATDLDGDGRSDLVATATVNGTTAAAVSFGRSDRTFSSTLQYSTPDKGYSDYPFVLGDVNGDQRPDLLYEDFKGDLSISGADVMLNDGTGAFAAPRFVPIAYGIRPINLAAADADGDGWLDLVTAFDASITVTPGNGDGTFGGTSRYAAGDWTFAVPKPALADLNGDGRPDLVTPLFTVELNQLPARVAPRLVTSAQLVDAHAVRFAFNAAIDPSSASASDLQIINLATGQTTTNATAVTRSGDGHTLTFTLPTTLADGNYRFRLAAGSILNTGGLANTIDLDAAGDAFILAGDANRDRTIDFADLLALARSYGRSGVSYSQGDFNYDGKVDFSDLLILARHYDSNLAAPPVATAPLAATASTRRRVAGDVLA